MTSDAQLDTLLRTLDPADPAATADSVRARTDLQRILADHQARRPGGTGISTSARPIATWAQRKRVIRRSAAVLGAVAAVTVGILALPMLQDADPAYASWTPEPAGMSAAEREKAGARCRADSLDTGDGTYRAQLESADVAVAERRGVWTTVVLTGGAGFSAVCITDGQPGLLGFGSGGRIGAIGTLRESDRPGPRDLRPITLGTGTMSPGSVSVAAGPAGTDIAAVVYDSPVHGAVEATVNDGQFALWMPGDELRNASSEGMPVQVTYRDGTVERQVLRF
ncbi:hypothetical protein BN1051_00139 [Arthrobacter saudimassiliensis]|uniref:Uncharacterized protein n=1 Tax=Arthrobacter saudimassiliensis TaxID=1461584 RepID=A0A078MHH3_9MICC|nr:hypothetical protein BN1051_00139 [Arthrobacter saudimassiliensis]